MQATSRNEASRKRAECTGFFAATTAIDVAPGDATFDNGAAHEGEFDFDPSKLDAAAAVDAFMQNHIRKSDWDAAP